MVGGRISKQMSLFFDNCCLGNWHPKKERHPNPAGREPFKSRQLNFRRGSLAVGPDSSLRPFIAIEVMLHRVSLTGAQVCLRAVGNRVQWRCLSTANQTIPLAYDLHLPPSKQ